MQIELKSEARVCMVEWVHGIHKHFKLHTETYFQTINIMDRFLEVKPISINSAQLLSLTCLVIACKYEEVLSPSLDNFVSVASSPFVTKERIMKAEVYVLKSLEFVIGCPSSYALFNIYIAINPIKTVKVTDKMIAFSKLILELFTLILPLVHFSSMNLCLAAYSLTYKAFNMTLVL